MSRGTLVVSGEGVNHNVERLRVQMQHINHPAHLGIAEVAGTGILQKTASAVL
jgi:hypothetical protein